MKKIYTAFFLSLVSFSVFSQVPVTSGNLSYSQDFNSISSTGTANPISSLPAGWTFLETGSGSNTTYAADNGSSNSGNTFSYGAAADAERSFGGLQSGSVVPTIGVSFINNTGSNLTSVTVSYTGEQWRLGALGRLDKLDFQYSVDATSLNSGTYTDENNLDFTAPVTTGAVGAINGNLAASRTAISFTISGLNVAPGSTIWFRWNDLNPAGSDDGLSIDDFTADFNGVTLPPCDEITDQPTNLQLSATPTSVSGSFDLIPAVTVVENYLVVKSLSSSLTQLPVDGTPYSTGQTIAGGNGTVVGISTGTFTDAVSPETQYYYFIFAMNDQGCAGGPNYNQVTPLSGSITTPALAPCTTPVVPSALTLTASNTTIAGSFTASGASKYLVLISTTTPLSVNPANASVYSAGQAVGNATVVSYGVSPTFNAAGLTAATPYYFYIFSANDDCTGAPVYSSVSLDGTATTTNATLGIPAGFYDAAAGLSCQSLKTSLRDISSNGYVQLTYTPGVWNAYQYTDIHRNDANTADIIWDIYSDNPTGPEAYTYTYQTNQCGNYSGEGSCYNREHSTPKSWFADAYPMYSDVQHLYPTDGYVNNTRSNYPYGEVTNNTVSPSTNGSKLGTGNNFGYTGTVFEPINAYKGDLARTSFYMATRYENEIIANNWSANGTANALFLSPSDQPDAAKRKLQIYDDWYLQTIYKWHNNDPVSQKEIDRNNAIYYQSGQNNRNPYVDHPEYVAQVFQCTAVLPVTLLSFTANRFNETALLKWAATFESSFRTFDVQRSTDGITFNSIGNVTGRNLVNYSFTDGNLPKSSVVYYRLKMIDVDGKFTTSKTVSIKLDNNFSNASVYPNPSFGKLTFKLDKALANTGILRITDITGRIVKTQEVLKAETNINVNVTGLQSGRYFISISNQSTVINQSFVVLQ